MWCEIPDELCQITNPVQIVLLSYLQHLFYVSESNKDKSTSELHFHCGIAVEVEGVWTAIPTLRSLTCKNSDILICRLKETEGVILAFIIQKPKSDKILFYLARKAELWVKWNWAVCMPGEKKISACGSENKKNNCNNTEKFWYSLLR